MLSPGSKGSQNQKATCKGPEVTSMGHGQDLNPGLPGSDGGLSPNPPDCEGEMQAENTFPL